MISIPTHLHIELKISWLHFLDPNHVQVSSVGHMTYLHVLFLRQRNVPTDTTMTTSRMVAMATGKIILSAW